MRKFFKWFCIALAALVLVVGIVVYAWLRSTLPDYAGDREVLGIADEVEILRDSWGMPHIYAKSETDAAFAVGYAQAQDRLFQMDMIRRIVRGRLAEILGEKAVPLDKFFRTITAEKSLEELATGLPTELTDAMNAYTAGVNAYLENPDVSLPVEFFLLDYHPEPWAPADCMASYYFMAWGLSFSFEIELVWAKILEVVGEELAREILIDYPEGYPIVTAGLGLDFVKTAGLAEKALGMGGLGGSNNWVISGEKSKTGRPILADDMHLGHGVPGFWYEAHLNTPEGNVSGVLIAGMPMVVVGANDHVAWGFTNTMVDDTDFYIEKINPQNPLEVEYLGRWERLRVKREVISVKDHEDIPFEIRLTRHGPLVEQIRPGGQPVDRAVALRWTAPALPSPAVALYRANRARSIDELEQALAYFKCPGQNWVYADRKGNIGYWAAVGIPLREGFDGKLPVPGWEDKYEWKGWVPTEDQPHMRNPPEGFIASANNKVVSDEYPHSFSHCYAMPDRIVRIREMLQAKEKLGIDDFMSMHMDQKMVMAREWVPKIISALETRDLSGKERQALQILCDWDFVARPDQAAPLIFHLTVEKVIENTFKKRLGDELYAEYIQGKRLYAVFNALRSLVNRGDSAWFDDPETKEKETLDDVIVWSFKAAMVCGEDLAGSDPGEWLWGDVHTVTFHHPFGRFSGLAGYFLDIGPFSMGGSWSTVNPAAYFIDNPHGVFAGASMRYIIDLGDMQNSLRVIPAGISGNFMSTHYDDQSTLWRTGAYRPFVLDRKSVEKDVRYRMKLVPRKE
jgi:penicillin amidase